MRRGEDADRQSEIIAALSRADRWGVRTDAFAIIETHLAVVFLAGTAAFKMKKSVDLGYLDFTSIAKRKGALDNELVLNRVTAPDLYRRVLPVHRCADGGFGVGGAGPAGAGEAVEWVLEMARFDQDDMLSTMANENRLAPDLATALGAVLVAMHAQAPRCRTQGWDDAVERVLVSNAGHLDHGASHTLNRQAVDRLIACTDDVFRRCQPQLEVRVRTGYVRRCHSDLHLANIVLRNGVPTPFDCIEFNDDFSCIDTLYDLAFLLMDLRKRGLLPFANRVLNAYLSGLRQPDCEAALAGLALLPLYMAMRAAVRAHVTAQTIEGSAHHLDAQEKAGLEATAAGYVALSQTLLADPEPRLIAVGGLSGTGKSTLSYGLAPELPSVAGAVVLRSDEVRKRHFGVAMADPLPPEAYTEEINALIYQQMLEEARMVLGAGQPVILDAVYAASSQRLDAERLAAQCAVPFRGFWLAADPAVMAARVTARQGDASDATAQVVERQLGYNLGDMTWVTLDAGQAPEAVRAAALDALDLGVDRPAR